MDIKIAVIVICDNKAFIPTEARYSNGLFTDVEPVYVAEISLTEITHIVQSVLSTEPTLLPELAKEDLKVHQNLLPKVTGTRSWKRLCQTCISYVIEISPKGLLLEMSRLDKKGRWEFDPSKRTQFAPGTDLSVVIRAVLKDLENRPR